MPTWICCKLTHYAISKSSSSLLRNKCFAFALTDCRQAFNKVQNKECKLRSSVRHHRPFTWDHKE